MACNNPYSDFSRPGRRAFTLVEILVVVTILGIIATIVGVSVGSRDDLKLTASQRVLVADLQYIQNRAIVQREPHFVQIGPYVNGATESLSFVVYDSGSWVTIKHPVERNDFVMKFGPSGSGGGQEVLLTSHNYSGTRVFGFDETGTPIFCDVDGTNRSTAMTETYFELEAGDHKGRVIIEPITGALSVQ